LKFNTLKIISRLISLRFLAQDDHNVSDLVQQGQLQNSGGIGVGVVGSVSERTTCNISEMRQDWTKDQVNCDRLIASHIGAFDSYQNQ